MFDLNPELFQKIARHCVRNPVDGYVLMDIDGCCLNNAERWARLQSGVTTYKQYVEEGHTDTPIPMGCVIYAMLIASPLKTVFNTARNEDLREMTGLQLEALFPAHDCAVWMRPHGNEMDDPELKLWQLERHNIKPSQVVLAFDDRPSVVEAYRKLGITAYQTDTGY
jgi:hypothetical protein